MSERQFKKRWMLLTLIGLILCVVVYAQWQQGAADIEEKFESWEAPDDGQLHRNPYLDDYMATNDELQGSLMIPSIIFALGMILLLFDRRTVEPPIEVAVSSEPGPIAGPDGPTPLIEPDFQDWLAHTNDQGTTFQQCPVCRQYGFFEVDVTGETTTFKCPGCGAEFHNN